MESASKSLPTTLKLIAASADEIAQHEKILGEIAKSSKKDPVWSLLNEAQN
jgi:DNA polymerase-3 subunit epsilon